MISINDFVDLISDVAGKTINKVHIDGPLGVRGRNSDNNKIKKELSWAPSKPLREGIEKHINGLKKKLGKLTNNGLMDKNVNSKDFTIVTACRNREENLRKAINSWINIDPYEIIIIDWGSERLIKSDDFEAHIRKYIKIIRYEHPNWVLTWAFNEGLSKVKTKYTIKLDCDHVVKEFISEENKCSKSMLIRGSHRYVNNGQEHINGAFMLL